MRWIRYSRYTGDDFGLSAEDLLKALSDFFLQSGFQNQYMGFSEWNQQTLEDLKNALQRALEQGEAFDPDQAQRIQQALENMTPEQMDDMLNRLVQKSHSDGTSGTVYFSYDLSSSWTNPSATQSNVVGRLAETWTVYGTTTTSAQIFGYDLMGRTTVNNQCTPLTCASSNYLPAANVAVNYTYDLAGNLTSAADPSGAGTYHYRYDAASRPNFMDLAGANLLTSITYNAAGAPV